MPTADEVAAAVWAHPILRRDTPNPADTIKAQDALSYGAAWAEKGLQNDRAEVGRDSDVLGRLVGLEQGLNTVLEAVAALAAKVDALAAPPPPAP